MSFNTACCPARGARACYGRVLGILQQIMIRTKIIQKNINENINKDSSNNSSGKKNSSNNNRKNSNHSFRAVDCNL